MTNMQIIDNFMPTEWWQDTYNIIDGDNFPWYLNKCTSYGEDNYYQMTHAYWVHNKVHSDWFTTIQPLINEFQKQTTYQLKNICRIKSNLLFNRPISVEQKQKIIHQDSEDPNYVTLLYYLQDSDGDTILYKDDKKTELMRIQPKANRAVIFDSRTWHTGELPVKNQTRSIINFVFEIK